MPTKMGGLMESTGISKGKETKPEALKKSQSGLWNGQDKKGTRGRKNPLWERTPLKGSFT